MDRYHFAKNAGILSYIPMDSYENHGLLLEMAEGYGDQGFYKHTGLPIMLYTQPTRYTILKRF
jgi:hypothetical protein